MEPTVSWLHLFNRHCISIGVPLVMSRTRKQIRVRDINGPRLAGMSLVNRQGRQKEPDGFVRIVT